MALEAAGTWWRGHTYVHDPASNSYGLEAAAALGVAVGVVYKTLIADVDGIGLAVGIVPVDELLDLKAFAKAAGGKRAEMAGASAAERSSGYVLGGISPIGQRKRLATYLDEGAIIHERIFVSGGRRGFDIEIAPDDLLAVIEGQYAKIAR